MTKRDFEKVAAVLRPFIDGSYERPAVYPAHAERREQLNHRARTNSTAIAIALAREFANGNQLFHAVTFFRACGFDPATSIDMKERLEHA